MTDYFSEHNCEPLAEGEAPNHIVHFVRMLLDGGWSAELQLEFAHLFPDVSQAPPASKAAVAALPTVEPQNNEMQCTVCLGELTAEGKCLRMPCQHTFHATCLLPWLQKTNSCPMCRHELPTDNADYEEHKRQKERQAEREKDIEELHNSMYS